MSKRRFIYLEKMAIKAMRSAVKKVVEEHRKSGIPLAIEKDGKVVHVDARKIRLR